ncbi:MAG: T9SS type A sorting domain-containing protein [Bacteroidales bacterium]|nr:T9SS type A sorting domain-containing protein [Bacteroidales bacterium]
MKNFLFPLIVVFSLSLNCQIIQFGSLPLPGDTFVFGVDVSPQVLFDYQQTGATWDFSTLVQDTLQVSAYGATQNLPYQTNFPTSNVYTYGPGMLYGGPGGIAPYQNHFGYMFFRTDSQGFTAVGFRGSFGGAPTNVTIQPAEWLMKTPFTLYDSISQNYTWTIALNAFPNDIDTFYTRHAFKYLTAVGSGTIITPAGTFSNCLLVKEFIYYEDSLKIKFLSNTILDTLLLYDTLLYIHAWTPSKRNHVFKAEYEPSSNTLLKMWWLKYEIHAQILDQNDELTLTVFPNPVKKGENISILLPNIERVYLSNILGKNVCELISYDQKNFTLPQIEKGYYILQIFSQNKLHTKPIIIVD